MITLVGTLDILAHILRSQTEMNTKLKILFKAQIQSETCTHTRCANVRVIVWSNVHFKAFYFRASPPL